MPFKVFQSENYDTSHERIFFDELIKLLYEKYNCSNELVCLVGSFSCNGNEVDGLFIKSGVISILEFKNYGGKLAFSENDFWTMDGIRVEAGNNTNPYKQVKKYRNALSDFLKLHHKNIVTNNDINWRHTSGVVLFHQPIQNEIILPREISIWFSIADKSSIIKTLDHKTSKHLLLTDSEIEKLISTLGLKEIELIHKIMPNDKIEVSVSEKLMIGILIENLINYRISNKVLKFINSFFNKTTPELFIKSKYSNFSILKKTTDGNPPYFPSDAIESQKRSVERGFNELELISSTFKKNQIHSKNNILSLIEKMPFIEITDIESLLNNELVIDSFINNLSAKFYVEFNRKLVYFNFQKLIDVFQNSRFQIADENFILLFFEILKIKFNEGEKFLFGNYISSLNEVMQTLFSSEIIESMNATAAFGFNVSWSNKICFKYHDFKYTKDPYRTMDVFDSGNWKKNITTGFIECSKIKEIKYTNSVEVSSKIWKLISDLLNKINGLLGQKYFQQFLEISGLNWAHKINFNEDHSLDFSSINLISSEFNRLFSCNQDFEFLNLSLKFKELKRSQNSLPLIPQHIFVLNILETPKNQIKLGFTNSHFTKLDESIVNRIKEVTSIWKIQSQRVSVNETCERLGIDLIDLYKLVYTNDDGSGLRGNRTSFSSSTFSETSFEFIKKHFLNKSKNIDTKQNAAIKDKELTKKSGSQTNNPILVQENNLILGYDDIKGWIEEHLIQILDPKIKTHLRLNNPDGILFFGLPGCGKTLFAKWVAKRLTMPFYEIPRSTFGSTYVDGAMLNLKKILDELSTLPPQVIFLDEFDSIANKRSNSSSSGSENQKVVNTLLQEIPKLIERGNVLIAATNFINELDEAVTRTGRFGPKIPIYPPTPKERSILFSQIFKESFDSNSPIYSSMQNKGFFEVERVQELANEMALFSNSDVVSLANILSKKAYLLFTQNKMDDFNEALILSSIKKVKVNCQSYHKFYKENLEYNNDLFPERMEILKNEIDSKCNKNSKKIFGYNQNVF